MVLQSYEIASGWNNSGSAVNVESITPSGAQSTWIINAVTNAYYFVRGLSTWNEQRERTAGASTYRRGFTAVQWELQATKYESYAYFYQTYVIDSGGKVTIRTTQLANSYAYQNAVITMTTPQEAEPIYGDDGMWMLSGVITLELRGTAS